MSSSKRARNNKVSAKPVYGRNKGILEETPYSNNSFDPVIPKNYAQGQYLDSIIRNQITFATGPAGTGKSYIATSYAAEQLFYKKIDKLIITRPAVEAGESMGFLPGELQEKYAPYLAPFRDILDKHLGKSFVDYLIKVNVIEPIPIGFMRGRTFKNALVIIMESQNTTPEQMKLILSRIGEGCKIIVEGDITQKDILGLSGLEDAINRLSRITGVDTVNFLTSDIVRSGLCRKIIQAYDN
jgi:phosphate starvation-inducible PhoH-like protein